MSQPDEFDRSVARWLDTEPGPGATSDVLDQALRATRGRRPRPLLFAALGSHWVDEPTHPSSGERTFGRIAVRPSIVLLLVLLALALVAGAVLVGAPRTPPAPDLGIFAPVAGKTVYGDGQGIWGVDPDGSAATRVLLTAEPGIPLDWSSDGTRLLIWREAGSELLVLDADGSETRLSERPLKGGRATISPDGSRVLFVAGTETEAPGGECCALYTVDADGGPAETFPYRTGPVEALTFAPDGTQIAYVTGAGDNGHSVWLVDVDGSDAHQIVANDTTLGAGHVHGLAWSPAGDRIALGLEGATYTFAPDGSSFAQVTASSGVSRPYWSPDGSQLEYRGPWHPVGWIRRDDEQAPPPDIGILALYFQSWIPDLERDEVAVYADGRVIWSEPAGYVEQRLTREGVEWLRSRAVSTGLFEHDLALGLASDPGNLEVRRGDRSVTVAWGTTAENVPGFGLHDPFVEATPAQAHEVTELKAFFRDPTAWGLPLDMYEQPQRTPFVPTHLVVGSDRARPDLTSLPSPAREIVTSHLEPAFGGGCESISIDQARQVVDALVQAGEIAPIDDVRSGFGFDLGRSFVHLRPALPHEVGCP